MNLLLEQQTNTHSPELWNLTDFYPNTISMTTLACSRDAICEKKCVKMIMFIFEFMSEFVNVHNN